jgi:hypothetical protein
MEIAGVLKEEAQASDLRGLPVLILFGSASDTDNYYRAPLSAATPLINWDARGHAGMASIHR